MSVVKQFISWISSINWAPDAITAASTVALAFLTLVLAVGTFFLWLATRRLVKGTERTAERQLRAYVFVHNGDVRLAKIGDSQKIAYKLSIEFKNFGQTPAKRFTTWYDQAVRDIGDLPFRNQPKADALSAQTILGPSATCTIEFAIPFEDGELEAVRVSKKGIFIWGACNYVDVFGQQRYFNF